MTDLRYDGPDLESETNTRVQGTLMAGAMIGEAFGQGRAARGQQSAATQLANDQAIWRDTPPDQLPDLGDQALGARWEACARHHGDAEANEARARIEAELTVRDPDTMREYRSWRNAAMAEPGPAMHQALAHRDARLADVWGPLAEPGAAGLPGDEVLTRWAAAHAAHGSTATTAKLHRAREVGDALVKAQDPHRWDAYQAMCAPSQDGRIPGTPPEAAAARTAGTPPPVFGPSGWATSAAGRVASTAATRTAGVTNPATAPLAVGAAIHQVLRKGMRQ